MITYVRLYYLTARMCVARRSGLTSRTVFRDRPSHRPMRWRGPSPHTGCAAGIARVIHSGSDRRSSRGVARLTRAPLFGPSFISSLPSGSRRVLSNDADTRPSREPRSSHRMNRMLGYEIPAKGSDPEFWFQARPIETTVNGRDPFVGRTCWNSSGNAIDGEPELPRLERGRSTPTQTPSSSARS